MCVEELADCCNSTYAFRMDLIRNDVKNKNGGDSWGTLYGRPMERLAFRYDRHEEIVRYFGCGMYTIIQW